jgi:hypothetical protein
MIQLSANMIARKLQLFEIFWCGKQRAEQILALTTGKSSALKRIEANFFGIKIK